ncbi:MAG: 2-succinyl-6-hydroxy-2,4-cyclohexadiene-1-carboxylate synthase [Salinibacter sp.]
MARMLHRKAHGPSEAPTLCFLHGFMGASADWASVVEVLSDDVHCLTVDLPGHGRSLDRADDAYSVAGATEAVVDVLDAEEIPACTLVGYSMGGRVALSLALRHPERVERLVLESASPGLRAEAERAERRAVDAARADRIETDLDAFLADWYRQPLFASLARHELVDEMVRTRSENDSRELARALRGMSPGRQASFWDRLDTLDGPTLILAGALDDKYVAITDEAATRIDPARRVVIPEAGHNVHAERPSAFLDALGSFLADTA